MLLSPVPAVRREGGHRCAHQAALPAGYEDPARTGIGETPSPPGVLRGARTRRLNPASGQHIGMTDASYLPGTLAACDTIADEPAAAPGEPSPAACWDAEYRAGRYSNEPPAAFAQDVVAAARQSGVARGLYGGCRNCRNYPPLSKAGVD